MWRKAYPECGWHHTIDWVQDWLKRGEWGNQLSTSVLSLCFLFCSAVSSYCRAFPNMMGWTPWTISQNKPFSLLKRIRHYLSAFPSLKELCHWCPAGWALPGHCVTGARTGWALLEWGHLDWMAQTIESHPVTSASFRKECLIQNNPESCQAFYRIMPTKLPVQHAPYLTWEMEGAASLFVRSLLWSFVLNSFISASLNWSSDCNDWSWKSQRKIFVVALSSHSPKYVCGGICL